MDGARGEASAPPPAPPPLGRDGGGGSCGRARARRRGRPLRGRRRFPICAQRLGSVMYLAGAFYSSASERAADSSFSFRRPKNEGSESAARTPPIASRARAPASRVTAVTVTHTKKKKERRSEARGTTLQYQYFYQASLSPPPAPSSHYFFIASLRCAHDRQALRLRSLPHPHRHHGERRRQGHPGLHPVRRLLRIRTRSPRALPLSTLAPLTTATSVLFSMPPQGALREDARPGVHDAAHGRRHRQGLDLVSSDTTMTR